MTDQNKKKRSKIFILVLAFLKLAACTRLEDFSDVHVEPVRRTDPFEEEDFIVTNVFTTKRIHKVKDLDDEEGSGSIDLSIHERISNYTTSKTPGRLETASGRHDYNTIRVNIAKNDTTSSSKQEYVFPRNLLVPGVICIAALGLVTGSLLAAIVVYQMQKRADAASADEISNFSTPNTSHSEEINISQNNRRARIVLAV